MEPRPLALQWDGATIFLALTPLSGDLAAHALPSAGLAVQSTCAFADQPPPLCLALAAGGRAAAALSPASGAEGDGVAAALHTKCLTSRSSVLLTPGPPDRELHLVALPGPVAFWLFVTEPGAAAAAQTLLTQKQLQLVLDLDETLLQAFTLNFFDTAAATAAARLAAAPPGAPHAAAEAELVRLLADRALLREYAGTDGVTLRGVRHAAVTEHDPVLDADAAAPPMSRPVVRIPGHGVVLTRIDPSRRETSMLVRIRPGWEELRAYLAGHDRGDREDGRPNLARFDVSVCTLSERVYAHEMWRLLDPAGALIPPSLRRTRLVATPPGSLKTLRDALGPVTCTPLALVVDDRLPIWEVPAQPHVLPCAPFLPYAAVPDGTGDAATGPWPLRCVQEALAATRADFFRGLLERVIPRLQTARNAEEVAAAMWDPVSLALRAHRDRALYRPVDAAPEPLPPAAGDEPRREELAAFLAAIAVPQPAAVEAPPSADAARAAAEAPGLGHATRMGVLHAPRMPAAGADAGAAEPDVVNGGANSGIAGRQPPTDVGAPPVEASNPFHMLRQEVERRSGILDWDSNPSFGTNVWTATAFAWGRQLARAQGPSRRAAQDAAAILALQLLRTEAEGEAKAAAAAPAPAVPPAAAALMAGLPGAPGGERALTAADAVATLSLYWGRLEADAGKSGGGELRYTVVDSAGAGANAVVVELWAGLPPRAIAKGAGPARKEATQKAALVALRQEGFAVVEQPGVDGPAAAAAAADGALAAKRRAGWDAAEAAAKRLALADGV